ncbi:MAG: leucine--tRNA ligase [Chloroflexi bacterium]|nr:leucine--tRNA ligase [Chloroflexota bacterium]
MTTQEQASRDQASADQASPDQASAERYDPTALEARWQRRWVESGQYRVPDHLEGRENYYHLTMLPYTSGDLHIGHWFAMAPSDTMARYRRMCGYNVLFPMGFDAFGLPAENAAIERGIHPKDWTDANIERMRGQLKRMGAMFDWDRELNTSAPDYYRWTQWWFLKLFEQGLAYRAGAAVNWCPSCNTVLANEQVVDGRCDRSGDLVEQRTMEQWFFRITQYADELLDNAGLAWPEHVKVMQRNWIGRSEGTEASFALEAPTTDGTDEIRVFTTRPDTLHGVTFMVLAPEHRLVAELTTAEQRDAVEVYVQTTSHASELERQSTERAKTGVFTGSYCLNRLTGERVPIWIADYVLASYGTGAVMAVPAHDARDFAFAQLFGLPIPVVIAPPDWDGEPLTEAYTGEGPLVQSGRFDGLGNREAIEAIRAHLAAAGWGGPMVQYRLRDWLISRQRYWGAPIPIVYCDACGIVPVPEDQLPIELPYDVEFLPTGQSPLLLSEEFVQTSCPDCGQPARRETDTMDTFMCSSWYFMRYADRQNSSIAVSPEAGAAWLPVDQYTGGAEHATMHLLYARFFYKAARDAGIVPGDEPFTRYFAQGQILGPDGRRMSKSRGNVVPPDDQVERWGADTFRAYVMFLGPWDQGGPYDVEGIVGVARWLRRVWALVVDAAPQAAGRAAVPSEAAQAPLQAPLQEAHRALERVSADLERFQMNTAVSTLMELTNTLARLRDEGPVEQAAWDASLRLLTLMLAPLCPHLAEELWERLGEPYSVHDQLWPVADAALTARETVELVVQVNGKVRDRLQVSASASEAEVRALAGASARVTELLAGQEPRRVIYVAGRLINFVVG